jgi:hypothetical protein
MKWLPLILLCAIFYTASPANAQEASLTINPPLIEIEAIPPTTLETPITIKNNSDDEVNLQILLLPITQSGSENGEVQFLSDTDAFPGANKNITEHIEIRERSQKITTVELLPKEVKKLDLYIGIDKDEPYSDYYFSVVFLPPTISKDNNEEISGSEIRAGIGTNVLLSVGQRNRPKGLIDTFSTPAFVQSGPVPFTVRIKNTGTHYLTPSGYIIVENMFGQKIGKVTLHKANILYGTTRAFISDEAFKDQLQKRAKNEKAELPDAMTTPTIIWPESFLLGPYKATLTVSLSDNGPKLVREARFFAFPWQLLIGILVSIVIAFAVKKRVDMRRERI